MVNGLAVLGWGVGGIEAEAAMLGQPITMLIPEVVGFKLTGKINEGITATDLVLTVTEMLRKKGVVGKFVEFYGPGLDYLSLEDQATIANMAPEYGATCGFFPVDSDTLHYLTTSGRDPQRVALVEAYSQSPGHVPRNHVARPGVHLDPRTRPHHRRALDLGPQAPAGPYRARQCQGQAFADALPKEFGKTDDPKIQVEGADYAIGHGDVVIAAITSCTNTSNPSVLVAAGLVARKARALGLTASPGSRPRWPPARRWSPTISTAPASPKISTPSASTSSAMAAPPASAIPARCRPKSPRPCRRAISSPPRCSRATAISKAA